MEGGRKFVLFWILVVGKTSCVWQSQYKDDLCEQVMVRVVLLVFRDETADKRLPVLLSEGGWEWIPVRYSFPLTGSGGRGCGGWAPTWLSLSVCVVIWFAVLLGAG